MNLKFDPDDQNPGDIGDDSTNKPTEDSPNPADIGGHDMPGTPQAGSEKLIAYVNWHRVMVN